MMRRVKITSPAVALLTIGLAVLGTSWSVAFDEADYKAMRRSMIGAIESDVRETTQWIGKRALDRRVLDVMAKVPRHEFVPPEVRVYAYENRPLPIGHGQTISQPYIVALMTDLLRPDENDAVLEIGTGSGYQAAVLSELVKNVYTIEIIKALGEQAAARLDRLGHKNVETRIADGYYGWSDHAPFDGILVTAAVSHIPPPLIRQLKPGGRMVIPVGSQFLTQQLVLVEKDQKGEIKTRQILPVRFVPLTGKH
jgi:protein-L-isoaspartate(D-aspartate) O-methyltransferase